MKKSLQKYKQEYLYYLGDMRGYSDATLATYDNVLNGMIGALEIYEEEGVTHLNIMPIRLQIKNQKPKTIAKKLSSMRSFVKYLQDEGEHVVLEGAGSIKVPKTLPKPVAHEHILEALEVANLQEKLIITMLYTLGLRISELSNIYLSDVSSEWIRVTGKGNKQRDVPLLSMTRELINSYRQQYKPKVFLFEKNGEKLSENTLRYSIDKIFKSLGLKVTPHQLRHSYATILLNNDARISDVSELLGHKSVATTQIYTKLSSSLKRENYMHAHPLCSNKSGS